MTAPVLLDFESRSRADLKLAGGRRYWSDPTSEPLCCAWYDAETGARGVWIPGDKWPHHGRQLGAHNAMGFDRFAADRLGWTSVGPWIDTSELARKAGLPGALDALGTRWLGRPKNKEGNRLVVSLSTVRRPPKAHPRHVDAATWAKLSPDQRRRVGVQKEIDLETFERVVAYCEDDVDLLAHGWPMLEPWVDVDEDVSAVDRTVNDRGVALDVDLCRALLRCDEENGERVVAEAAALLDMTSAEVRSIARSPAQFCEALGCENAQKATAEALDHPLARARLALASIARGKLVAGLARVCDDGRLRDVARYYGAHTGRWSGRGMQLQNLPRPSKALEDLDDDVRCRLADAVLAGRHVATPDEIDVLLRACVWAPSGALAVCDFAGVEARALAWIAGDVAAVDVLTSGRHPYRVAGAAIYGLSYEAVAKGSVEYSVGKMAELACGYGGGPGALLKIANANGITLPVDLDPRAVVDAWRDAHRPIVRFWYAVERAFRAACEGRAASVGPFEFLPSVDGDAVAAMLPSGRPIVYNDPRVDDDGLSYAPAAAFARERTYGGKLAENLIQAWCRDLLADALVRAERAGLNPVMHVHDEIVCEAACDAAADAYDHLQEVMTTLPGWAAGFPVAASGFIARRYAK